MPSSKTQLILLWTYVNISLIFGEPIYYSPYIKSCEYEKARNHSKLQISWPCADSDIHAGYFTVDEKLSMNLYSLFVKSKTNWEQAPVIVWLQGQPGCTSLYAAFGQNGPCRVDDDLLLQKNVYAWNNEYNVLYLDNLIFTGYSYALKPSSYSVNLRFMSKYLYEALNQFYQMYTELISNDLYIAGEMYTGKYALLLGNIIHEKNAISHMKMPLKGLYIGSGFTDPENMMDYSHILYEVGLIDYNERNELRVLEQSIKLEIRSNRFFSARQQYLSIWKKLKLNGYDFPMDFTQPGVNFNQRVFDFLTSMDFQKACGLEKKTFYSLDDGLDIQISDNSLRVLQEVDVLKSCKHLLPILLNHYKVLYYAGQLDALVPYVLIQNFINKLEWKGAEQYYNNEKTPREIWYVDNVMAGFRKTVFNLTVVMVRNSAQMIDVSQPKWAYHLLQTFIDDSIESEESQETTTVGVN